MTSQAPKRYCAECKAVFQPRRATIDLFCCAEHRRLNHNREYLRGRSAYRALYHWRKGRGQGDAKGLFQELCRIVDEWVREDKERDYNAPPAHVRRDSHFATSPKRGKAYKSVQSVSGQGSPRGVITQ